MQHYRTFLAVLLAMLPVAASSQVTFTQTAGPGTNQIWSYAKLKNNTVLVATSKKVFRTTDQGTTWLASQQSFDIGTKGTLAVTPDGQTAYCMDAAGLSSSVDQGATWTRVTSLAATNLFGVTASSSGTIMVGSYNAGVYVSTDNGGSWTPHSNGLPREPGVNDLYPVVRLVSGPNGVVYAIAQGGGLSRSNDQGSSWTVVGDGTLPQTISGCAVASDGKVYATGTTGVFVSGDNGATWQNLANSNGLNVTGGGEIATDDAGSGVLLSSGAALWLTTGGSWSKVRPSSGDDHTALLIGGNDAYYLDGMANNSVFRSTDNGSNWTPSARGIISAAVPAMAADSAGRVYAVADTNGLYVSNDFGDTWSLLSDASLPAHNVSSITAAPNGDLYVTIYGIGLMQSTDQGQHWTNQAPNMPGTNKANMLASCATPSDAIFTSGFNGTTYRSTNSGTSWAVKRTGIPTDTVKMLYSNSSGTVFAVCPSGVFSTTNSGDAWAAGTNAPTGVTAFATIDAMAFATNATGMFASSDNGTTWIPLSSTILGGTGLVAAKSGGYYAATKTALYFSADGLVWSSQSFPFATAPIGMIQDKKYGVIYVGTAGSGAYRSPAPKGANDVQTALATPRMKIENYPNPFTSVTTLSYRLADAERIELFVTDLSGKVVATIDNGLRTSGEHVASFDPQSLHLAAGTYLCVLRTDSAIASVPMVYLGK